MTDTEKVALIRKIIIDYRKYGGDATIEAIEAVTGAVLTVADFECEKNA